jgi:hypothetical protein
MTGLLHLSAADVRRALPMRDAIGARCARPSRSSRAARDLSLGITLPLPGSATLASTAFQTQPASIET